MSNEEMAVVETVMTYDEWEKQHAEEYTKKMRKRIHELKRHQAKRDRRINRIKSILKPTPKKIVAIGVAVALTIGVSTLATERNSLYNKAEVKAQNLTIPTQLYTEENLDLLAKVLHGENGGNSDEATYLTGVVVLKRVKSKDYPNTIREVIYQKGQYAIASYLDKIEPSDKCYELAEDLLINGVDKYPDNLVYQSHFKQGKKVYAEYNGEYFCLK